MKKNLQLVLMGTIILTFVTLLQLGKITQNMGIHFRSDFVMTLVVMGVSAICMEAAALFAVLKTDQSKLSGRIDKVISRLNRSPWMIALIYLVVLGVLSFLMLGPYRFLLKSLFLRLLVFWLAGSAGAVAIYMTDTARGWVVSFLGSMLFTAFFMRIVAYVPDVSRYPFSLDWSEASRYYYASLYLSKNIYGINVPPTVLHPSRYLLQAFPFLIPDSSLWLHRLWQVFLWLGITTATSYMLVRRLAISDKFIRGMFIIWTFLFLFLGPVYYHLQISLLLVLWGFRISSTGAKWFRSPKFYKSLTFVIAASLWAGISRLNWFPVPGMLAAILYFLEERVNDRPLWKYISRPVIYICSGTIAAFVSQTIYAYASGNPLGQFTSSFSSDLLFYRLLPNPTFPLGVILSALIVSAPFLVLVYIKLSYHWRKDKLIRIVGIIAILLVLLAGGLIVSVKIGGGSNLHNLDAYLTLLMIVVAYFAFDKTAKDNEGTGAKPTKSAAVHWSIYAFIIFFPIYHALNSGSFNFLPEQEIIDESLEKINLAVSETVRDGEEVLFLAERQLITFNTLQKKVPLVPEYERVFMMEMVMSGNVDYLERFRADIRKKRFGLIVSEPVFVRYKGKEESFGEENDVWVKQVYEPILCSYETKEAIRELRVEMFVPRMGTRNCP